MMAVLNAKWDSTVLWEDFEVAAFLNAIQLLAKPGLHLMVTIDDDLYGSRAKDVQVKTKLDCKACGKGHTADCMSLA